MNTDIVFLGRENHDGYKFGNIFKFLNYSYSFIDPNLPDDLLKLNPRLIITTSEWIPRWRITIYEAIKKGIKVIYLIDGIVDWELCFNNTRYVINEGTFMQPIISDKVLCIGSEQCEFLKFIGCDIKKLEIVGIPRFDKYKTIAYSLNKNKKLKGLVVTPKTFALNEKAYFARYKFLEKLVKHFDYNKINVIYRIDPCVALNLGVDSTYLKNSIDDDLRECDFVLSFPSTSIFESMIYDKPTALINCDLAPLLVKTPWVIQSESDVEQVLCELMNPEQIKMAYQRYLLNNNVSYIGRASEKLKNIIEEILDGKTSQQFDDSELVLNKYDFREHYNYNCLNNVYDKALLQYIMDGYRKKIKEQENTISCYENSVFRKVTKPFMYLLEKFLKNK